MPIVSHNCIDHHHQDCASHRCQCACHIDDDFDTVMAKARKSQIEDLLASAGRLVEPAAAIACLIEAIELLAGIEK